MRACCTSNPLRPARTRAALTARRPRRAQLLDPQQAPFSAKRWYNASTEKLTANLGYVDVMWNERGVVTHKRVGESFSNTDVPALVRPRKRGKGRSWRGTRITQVGAKFWPDVEAAWEKLNAGKRGASWLGTPRVLLLQSGTWYRSMQSGRFCVLRPELCKMPGPDITRVIVREGRHAMDALDAWAAAHRETRVDVHLATVSCKEKTDPCQPTLRAQSKNEGARTQSKNKSFKRTRAALGAPLLPATAPG